MSYFMSDIRLKRSLLSRRRHGGPPCVCTKSIVGKKVVSSDSGEEVLSSPPQEGPGREMWPPTESPERERVLKSPFGEKPRPRGTGCQRERRFGSGPHRTATVLASLWITGHQVPGASPAQRHSLICWPRPGAQSHVGQARPRPPPAPPGAEERETGANKAQLRPLGTGERDEGMEGGERAV